jgi:hypothetical protein
MKKVIKSFMSVVCIWAGHSMMWADDPNEEILPLEPLINSTEDTGAATPPADEPCPDCPGEGCTPAE